MNVRKHTLGTVESSEIWESRREPPSSEKAREVALEEVEGSDQ
jgi:hypothetical protein